MSERKKTETARIDMDSKKVVWETSKDSKTEAESAERIARGNYETSARYTQTALADYMNHTVSCYYCVGSSLCSIGQQAYDGWQSWDRTMKADKRKWERAKSDLKAKTSAEYIAYNNYWTARFKYGSHKRAADYAYGQWTALRPVLDNLGTKLGSLEADLLLKRAKVQAAKRDFDAAKATLSQLETDYPVEWAEAMSDPGTRYSVEYIRSH